MNKEKMLAVSRWENKILELIEDKDSLTQSDLQGAAGALVLNIMASGVAHQSVDEWIDAGKNNNYR